MQAHTAIAQNANFEGVIGQGVAVLFYLVGGVLLALALYWGLRRLERGGSALTGRALALSRDRRVLRGVAIGAAILALVAAVAVGQRAWDQFTSSDVEFSADPDSRISSLSGSGRDEFFRVALDAFGEKPVLGHGAGTYQFSWFELRDIDVPVHNAHSLYLQAFAELGIVGGLLTLATVLGLLWIGFSAWRGAGGAQRELLAALLAASLAFAVGAAIDWLWQIAALGFVFFLASGALVAARCGQLSRRRATSNGDGRAPRRYGLAVAGLAVAWLTALALIGPCWSTARSTRANRRRRAATSSAPSTTPTRRARSSRGQRPHTSSSACWPRRRATTRPRSSASGRRSTARTRTGSSIYLRAKAEHEAGNMGAAEADLAKAQQLNPLEACLTKGWDGCG